MRTTSSTTARATPWRRSGRSHRTASTWWSRWRRPRTTTSTSRSTKTHGTIAIYANNGGNELSLPLRETFSKNLRYQFLILYTLDERFLQAAVEDVSEAVRAGALRVGEDAGVPLHHFPLDHTAAAHDAVEGGAVGKVLLDIAAD